MQMIIASRLVDGRVVFMDAEARWAESIDNGALLATDEEAEQGMSTAAVAIENCEIVDPYPIEVLVENGERRPAEVREAIRAFGPSVRTDHLDENE